MLKRLNKRFKQNDLTKLEIFNKKKAFCFIFYYINVYVFAFLKINISLLIKIVYISE